MTMITQIFIGIAFDTKYLDHCKSAKRDKMLIQGVSENTDTFVFHF